MRSRRMCSEVTRHVTNVNPNRRFELVCSTKGLPSWHSCNAAEAPDLGCGTPGREVNHLTSFFTYLNALRTREEGQTMAEYGVVLAVITIGVVVALLALSG